MGRDVVAVLKTTWREIGDDRVSVYAAQMAYAFFFSLFPLLLFFAALFNLIADKQTVQSWFNTRLVSALPADVAGLLGKTIEKVVFAKGAPGILSFGLLTAAWSGSGVFGTLRGALNDAYDVAEKRPWWKQYAIQLGMLLLSGVVLLGSTVILLNGEGVMGWIGTHLHLGRLTTLLWTVLQFPLAIAGLVAVLWLTYYILPNCKHQGKLMVLFGALLSTLLFLAATLLFRVYVQKFNQLNPAYGAIGAIMVLLTWMYYSSYVLLAVGELVSVLENWKEQAPSAEQAVPRERALVPVRQVTQRAGLPRWAASTRADGGGRWRRGLRRLGIIPLVDRVCAQIEDARHWLEGALEHLRTDVAVARREISEVLRGITTGSAIVAIAGVLALLGGISLMVGLILLVGDQWLPSDLFWVAALIVVVITGPIAYAMSRRGRAMIAAAVVEPASDSEPLPVRRSLGNT
jgi:membrane protein